MYKTGDARRIRSAGHPSSASVSAPGSGGSNGHLALEKADPGRMPRAGDLHLLRSAQTTELVLLSAPDRATLVGRLKHLHGIATRISWAELTDLAAALAQSDRGEAWRVAVVVASPRQLAAALARLTARIADGEALDAVNEPSAGSFAGVLSGNDTAPTLVALFPGQGNQRPDMGAHWGRRYPFVQEIYGNLDAAIADLAPGGVRRWTIDALCQADLGLRESWSAELRATEVAQPALVAAALVTLKVLGFHGLIPDMVLGHSLGEIIALCAAGAFDPEVAVRIAAFRGRAIAELDLPDPGAMAAVMAEASIVSRLVAPFGARLTIAYENSPRQTVVSGATDAILQLTAACAQQGIACRRLAVSHAFHSDWVAPAADALWGKLGDLTLAAPSKRMISTVTGEAVPPSVDVRRWICDQIHRPVQFTPAVRRAHALRPALWVEVGPGQTLSQLTREILGPDAAPVLTTDRPGVDGLAQLNAVLGQAFVVGLPVDRGRLFAHRPRGREVVAL
jgi:enediyne polyketide synthase